MKFSSAPTALKKHEIGIGKSLTSYPSFKEAMTSGNLYNYKEDRVVVDGIITSMKSSRKIIKLNVLSFQGTSSQAADLGRLWNGHLPLLKLLSTKNPQIKLQKPCYSNRKNFEVLKTLI